jgi:hypothetical protein
MPNDYYRNNIPGNDSHSFNTGISVSPRLYYAGYAGANAVIYRASEFNYGAPDINQTYTLENGRLSSVKAIAANNGVLYALFVVKDNAGGTEYGRLYRIHPGSLAVIDYIERGKKTMFNCIAPLANGDLLVGGSLETDETGITVPFISRYGESLQLKYTKYFTGEHYGMDSIDGAYETHDGGFVLCGTIHGGETAGRQYLFIKTNRNGDVYR